MIQTPQMQYMPVQQPVQAAYQPQVQTAPVQYNQTPGVLYNYPTTSCYSQPYCTGKSQYNGVNIEIINPQGQGMSPQGCYQMPAQYVPVQQQVAIPQPYAVPYPVSQAVNQAPQPYMQPTYVQPQQPAVQQIPAPQITPQQPQIQPAYVQPQQPAPQVVQPQTVPAIQQPAIPDNSPLPESFAGRLKSSNPDEQKAAIEEIAEAVKNNKPEGRVLIDTVVVDALVDIIDKDTSSLQAPSPEVLALRQKPQDQLSAAEKEKATTPSPLEKAEINQRYALYTIAYMQDRLNKEVEAAKGQPVELKDLPCIEKVIDTVKSNQNPMLRASAIASLSYIARPGYKADLSTIFELAKNDEDADVRDAAAKALEALNK